MRLVSWDEESLRNDKITVVQGVYRKREDRSKHKKQGRAGEELSRSDRDIDGRRTR